MKPGDCFYFILKDGRHIFLGDEGDWGFGPGDRFFSFGQSQLQDGDHFTLRYLEKVQSAASEDVLQYARTIANLAEVWLDGLDTWSWAASYFSVDECQDGTRTTIFFQGDWVTIFQREEWDSQNSVLPLEPEPLLLPFVDAARIRATNLAI